MTEQEFIEQYKDSLYDLRELTDLLLKQVDEGPLRYLAERYEQAEEDMFMALKAEGFFED